MIGFLRGTIVLKQPPLLVLDVGGVGYEVQAPMSTFYALSATGGDIRLYTHLVVRADAHELFGFGTLAERGLFRSLIKISGVGPRLALAILSGASVEGFLQWVEEANTDALIRVPGVGKKTAQRLIVELRDRLDDAVLAGTTGDGAGTGGGTPAEREAHNALVALGYKSAEARRMLKAIATDGMQTEDIVRSALRGSMNADAGS